MARMTRNARLGAIAAVALAVSVLGAPTVPVSWADPPEGHGHGHGHGDDDQGRGAEHRDRHEDHQGHHFQDRDRVAVRGYYEAREHEGRCPPGLAKKGNGCMPPGHARAWAVGSPLPPGVVAYDLPPALVVQLTPPPVGYRYVRVASDVLMIAAGTGMVAEAIQDLGR